MTILMQTIGANIQAIIRAAVVTVTKHHYSCEAKF